MLEIGMSGRQTLTVSQEFTAQAMGSGELPVFATPAMIALMEKTAWTSVAGALAEGQGTVGTLMNVKHLAATPIGCEVTCETTLIEIDRRRLVFEVCCKDSAGVIGEGTHERFIVDNERFLENARRKHV